MYEGVLRQFRTKIRTRQYVVTIHADEEMDEDDLTILDLESAILTGTVIERQRDRRSREWKYVVHGHGREGDLVGVVAKLSPTGHLVIITAYRE